MQGACQTAIATNRNHRNMDRLPCSLTLQPLKTSILKSHDRGEHCLSKFAKKEWPDNADWTMHQHDDVWGASLHPLPLVFRNPPPPQKKKKFDSEPCHCCANIPTRSTAPKCWPHKATAFVSATRKRWLWAHGAGINPLVQKKKKGPFARTHPQPKALDNLR